MSKVDTLKHRQEVKQKIIDIIREEYDGYDISIVFTETLFKEIINDLWKSIARRSQHG